MTSCVLISVFLLSHTFAINNHRFNSIVYVSLILFLQKEFLWNFATDILPSACALSSAPPTVRIVHSGHACNVEEERYTERVYTIREGETLELTCLVTGHPRPQVSLHYSSAFFSDIIIVSSFKIDFLLDAKSAIFWYFTSNNSHFLSYVTHFQNTKHKPQVLEGLFFTPLQNQSLDVKLHSISPSCPPPHLHPLPNQGN